METQKSANSFVKIYFLKIVKTWKSMILAGDFNINALDYEQNKKNYQVSLNWCIVKTWYWQ